MDSIGLICNRLAEIAVEDLGSDGSMLPRELDDLVCALSSDTGVREDVISTHILNHIYYLHSGKQA
jgi:hypothetical protein